MSVMSDNQSCKRKTSTDKAPSSKRRKLKNEPIVVVHVLHLPAHWELITPFDPTSLVKSKEGFFKTPSGVSRNPLSQLILHGAVWIERFFESQGCSVRGGISVTTD